jgi:multiple sugar transport system substrate-binding protein
MADTARNQHTLSRRNVLKIGAGAATLATFGASPAFVRAQSGDISGSVTTWCYPLASGGDQAINEQMWAGLVTGFNAQYPNVEVKVEVLPWADRNTKLTTALAAGAGPDVGYLNADFVPQHAGDGNLEAVDDVIADEIDDFLENARTNLSVDGTLYAVPTLSSVTTLLYNTKVFEAAGLTAYPKTWEELLAAGPAIKASGNFLTSYAGSLESTLNLSYFPLLWQAGGEVINAEGTAAAFNSPEGLEALNFVVTLFNEGYVDLDEGTTNPPPGAGLIDQGKVGVILNGAQADALRLNETWGEGVLQVGPPLSNKQQVSYGTTAGWGIFKGSENVDAAKAWVKYITSPEPMTTIDKSGGYIAPRASLAEIYADDPLISQFTPFVPLMHGDIRHPQARAIISAMGPFVQAAFLGDQSPEEALEAAGSDVNRLLERG